MSGQFALAVEEAKKFRNQLANVFEVLDYVSKIEHPEALEANIRRLKADSQNLVAKMREQAETEAKRNMQAAVDAAGLKAKSILEEAEAKRTEIINAAQIRANKILADARTAGEALTKKFADAHAAAQEKLR